MPLWTIYHPRNTFTNEEEKQAFSNAITGLYTAVPLPAFYVVVLFVPIEPNNFYVGGVSRPSPFSSKNGPGPDSSQPFIRITIRHIARKVTSVEIRDRILAGIDRVIKPFVGDKGYDWEYDIEETSRDLWKTQGLVPPMPRTAAEEQWVKENRPVNFEDSEGGLPHDGSRM